MGIGQRIKRVRVEADLLQADVAECFQNSQPQISQWEKGRGTSQYDAFLAGLVRLARRANVTLDHLVTGADQSHPTDARAAAVAFARSCGYHEDAIAHAEQVTGVTLSPREWFRIIETKHDAIILGAS